MPRYPKTSQYEDSGYVALAPGDYEVELHEVQDTDRDGDKLIDKNNDYYVRFVFRVIGIDGQVSENFYFNEDHPNANVKLGKFKQFQTAAGIDSDSEGDTADLLKKRCMVSVVNREYNDKIYANIKQFYPLDGPPTKEDDDDLPF